MGIIWKTIADNWGIILMAPGVFIAAILLGWLAGWMVVRLVYNQRLAHQQDMITNLRAVLEVKLPTSFLSPPQQKRSKQMSFGLVLIFAGIGAALIGATIVTSDRSPPPSKQPPNMEPGVSTLPQAPPIAALPDPKIADLQSQLNATKAQFETTRKELADVRLTPTAEKDIQQNRLRFKLEQAKIDKADFDNAIAAVRASAEGALSVAKAWAINPPEYVVGNMPLRAERNWEDQIRGLQKLCDRVFLGEEFVVTPREPTPKELTYQAPGDSEMKDPDSKQRFRILNFRTSQQEYILKQIERKIEDEISSLTNQIREMR